MRSFFLMMFVVLFSLVATGCLVRTRGHHHHGNGHAARCAPGHYWNGNRCVHNRHRH